MDYKLINLDYLEAVSGGDVAVIAELVGMFREQVVEFYAEMKSLYSEQEYRQLGLLAHKAKSSVAIMGMDALADVLKTLELSAKESQKVEIYESCIERFYKDTEAALLELDDYLSKK